jgi:hypothetical protein
MGYVQTTGNGLATGFHPYDAAAPGIIDPSNIYNNQNWFFTAGADGEWDENLTVSTSVSSLGLSVGNNPSISLNIQPDDQVDFYFSTKDDAGRNHIGHINYAVDDIQVVPAMPSDAFVSDYVFPSVKNIGDQYYFFGFHTIRNRYEIVLGTDSSTFDWGNAREIPISPLLDVSEKWFSDEYEMSSGLKLPYVPGFEILNVDGKNVAYIFYSAGDSGNAAYAGPTERGYGVIKVPMFE